MTTCYLLDEKVGIKCISCEPYPTNAALTRLLSQEKSLNMGRGSTGSSIYRYGRLQQIHHWTTWFPTAPRHRWIHLQVSYNLRKDRATSSTTTWRCSKNRSKKCPSFVYFNPTDESLTAGPKEHNHPADAMLEQKKDLITSLKRKAEDQQLTSTQNILTETLSSSTPDLNVAPSKNTLELSGTNK